MSPKIKFKSIYTGKQDTYDLGHDENLTKSRCPIDGTPLYNSKRSGSRIWNTEIRYCCPNCHVDYYHKDEVNLQREKKSRIERQKKDLAKLRDQESRILQFLKAAGEKA